MARDTLVASPRLCAPGSGSVTASQPRVGIALLPAKRSGVHPAGERPEASRPTRRWPSQRIAKASEPMPLTAPTSLEASPERVTVVPGVNAMPGQQPRSCRCAGQRWIALRKKRCSFGLPRVWLAALLWSAGAKAARRHADISLSIPVDVVQRGQRGAEGAAGGAE